MLGKIFRIYALWVKKRRSFDRRIWKEAYRNKDGAALSQPTRSYYLYADEGLIAESQQPITPPLPV